MGGERGQGGAAGFAAGESGSHGRVEMWREGSVIRVEAAGPFNLEAVRALGAAWIRLFSALPLEGGYAEFTTIRGSLIASPDAIAAFRKLLYSNNASGRAPRAVAWVVGAEVEGGRLMLPMFAEIHAEARRVFRAFDAIDEADRWLRERLLE